MVSAKLLMAAAALATTVRASEPGPPAECERYEFCNGDMCEMICRVGTVVIDEWAGEALRFQRELGRQRSYVFWVNQPGVHNGGQALDWGFGIEERYWTELLENDEPIVIAEQRHSPYDQLRMGARNIELDVYYFENLSDEDAMGVRVCHWPICPLDIWLTLEEANERLGKNYKWDCGRLGCDEQTPSWERAMEDIRRFLDENPEDFVTVYIDNKLVLDPQIAEFKEVTQRFFPREMMFTPEDVQDRNDLSTWPSVADLVSQGKRIVFENNRDSWATNPDARDTFFTPPIWSGSRSGSQFGLGSFQPYDACTVGNRDYYGVGQSRWFDGSINLGPLNGHPLWGGRSNRAVADQAIQDMSDCGIGRLDKDQLQPANMEHMVWSWERDEPSAQFSCAKLNVDTGRWSTADCTESLPVSCAQGSMMDGVGSWTLSAQAVPFADGLRACQQNNSTFDKPWDGLQNSQLLDLAKVAGRDVWVNVETDGQGGWK